MGEESETTKKDEKNKKDDKKKKKDGKKKDKEEKKEVKNEKKDEKTKSKSPHSSFNYVMNRISTICHVCSSPSLRSLWSDLCT